MSLRRSAVIFTILSVVAGLAAPAAVPASTPGGLSAVWNDYAVAQKRFQYDLAKLLEDGWPQLGEVAGLQRDLQFALIELNNLRFQFLLENDPDRLVIDQGLDTFVEFEWTEKDGRALRDQDERYAKLERWVEKFTNELSDHPRLSEADHSIGQLHYNQHYRTMIVRYQAQLTDIESALETAARNRTDTM
jgi:hypothetical protein